MENATGFSGFADAFQWNVFSESKSDGLFLVHPIELL